MTCCDYMNCHVMSLMDLVYIINCGFKMMHADTYLYSMLFMHAWFRGFTYIQHIIVSVIQYLEYNVNVNSVT